MRKFVPLLISLAIVYGFALIGSLVTTPSIGNWYQALIKPSFNPPNWLFGPAWTLLFTLMGISAYFIWNKLRIISFPLVIYGLQLGLNFLWSYLFFGLHRPDFALIDIVILWLFILATIVSFYKVDKAAAYLLLPYLVWVSFASLLNYKIFILN